jgi:predicted RNA-binding protein with PIN domain
VKEESAQPQHPGRPYYIVDGYNVIFSSTLSTARRGVEETREYFLRILDAYASRKRVEIAVVWDGSGSPVGKKGGRVKNIFSTRHQSADEKIIKMVQRQHNRKRITVVSDDRRHIIGVIRDLGAQSMGVSVFLDLVGYRLPMKKRKKSNGRKDIRESYDNGDGGEKVGASDLSVEDWLKLFRSRSR